MPASGHRLLLTLGLITALVLPAQADEPKFGVQLWSVREDVAADFEATLMALADMGFEGVEFAGDYGAYADNPEALKAFMDKTGLACSGAHVMAEMLEPEVLDQTVAFHAVLGCPAVIIPWDERAYQEDEIAGFIEAVNLINTSLEGSKMAVGFHNHWQEFDAFEDATFWDAFARGTPDEVILQLDVRHAAFAGKSPLEYIKRYPGRTFSSHFKAFVPEGGEGRTIIGDDALDWPALNEAARGIGGTQWIIIEQEIYPDGLSPMESTALSLAGFKAAIAQP